ncbi:kinesin family protein [Histoplasma ohiense]|nr:kinesin family protein [Histoplasma ohiense (nom. inval.)]
MANSPPASPIPTGQPRPMSAMIRPPRSNSRMSMSSKQGGSRASDEDTKTAVKVAVRVRPPLKPTDPGFELIPQRFQRSTVHVTSPTSVAVDAPQGRKLFVFDRVFAETVDQEGIWEYLQDSVNSFVQGYNVSILAYGQSGAGKSYTMGTSGPTEQSDQKVMGIIPRAAQLLFEKLTGTTHTRTGSTGLRTPTRYSVNSSLPHFGKGALDKSWQLKATYVEIYNEQLRDLLLPDTTPIAERGSVTIREDTKGRILLTGLHQVNINSFEDLIGALNFGSSIRQTDATAINAKSSRSHAVFSLNLVQRKDQTSTLSTREKRLSMPVEALSGADISITVDSKLHFVDLAGSERLKNTGASGERAKEGISINAGLASLGKVISQLSSRQAGSHVSYRDSKLTRLLQDSLGGNAITYMIACVTPAEFHLSETLNTVQYAQRARAIQSKPRIQQITDESDKQAVIDRLKAEVAFLRQQINNSEGGDRRSNAPQERAERQNEREIELQNHLLDVQESYTALSQRHAKLISELTKATDFTGDTDDLQNLLGDSAMERLKRSHSFAESVEQVVLEYEKTIQSLESSLSNTRSSLSNTESSLLEKETKCAYIETVNAQLQARIQKMMDREANTEHYLHELESKLDGHTTGEEKNAAIIAELRKEIARARENEASCEDYISTLEERLAEADQDMELMQREMDRLEHVIDRQRSLGKLDTLLYELDHIQQNGAKSDDGKGDTLNHTYTQTAPVAGRELPKTRKRGLSQSLDVLMEAVETAIPESDDDLGEIPPESGSGPSEREEVGARNGEVDDNDGLKTLQKASGESNGQNLTTDHDYPPQSPAQSRFVAEKLEDVTQELFELRIQHETTTNEYDLLHAKYEEALRTLAELQDAVDEARHPANAAAAATPMTSSRPVSFLEDSRLQALRSGGQPSSSRLLSSELSLAEQSAITQEHSENGHQGNSDLPNAFDTDEPNHTDVENMQKLLQEHQHGMSLVTQKYAQLQSEHEETLNMVEDLKQELQRTKSSSPTTPSPKAQVIRRMTSQNMTTVDRAHRSLASLRNIAIEEFEGKPDTMQTFEVSLNTAMHELHIRMERIQALEAENKNVKKEMETKATIISGLTRERSSLSGSSPMDISVVSQMRDQILQHENQIKEMQEAHDAREKELTAKVQSLNELLGTQKALVFEKDDQIIAQNQKIVQLEEANSDWEIKHQSVVESLQSSENKLQATLVELQAALAERAEWQSKHRAAAESLQSSEKQLQNTMVELEAALANIDALRSERNEVEGASADEMAAAAKSLETARVKHQELVDGLKFNIEEQKITISTHLSTISGLESSLAAAKEEISQHENDGRSSNSELESYRARVAALEQEIESHKATVEAQKAELMSLQESHKQELEELEVKVKAAAEARHESRMAEENVRNEQAVSALRAEISASKNELAKLLSGVTAALNAPVTVNSLQEQIEDLLSQKQQFAEKYSALFDTNEDLVKELETKTSSHAKLERQFTDLTEKSSRHEAKMTELAHLVASHEDALKEKEDLIKKKDAIINEITVEKQKSARLVEELEEQITNTFDQHHNRLSVIQQERHQALDEANLKIGNLEKEIESYRIRIEQLEGQMRNGDAPSSIDRTGSMTSNLRKSASAASLPSPPPAIPLPPLPNIAAQTGSISPPSSRHTSKELVNAQLVEDQEARIRTIEKHLHAEKQLTATLEEALGDLEAQSNKVKTEMEAWKKKAWQYEDELTQLRSERNSTRLSIQAVEEERNARREAEAARAHLEEKMNAISKKKKKSTLNCF